MTSPAPETATGKPALPLLIGGTMLVVTLAAMAGWLLQEPRLIVSINGRILFNSALCFALAGTVLLLNLARSALCNPLRMAAGAVIALISLVTLLEHIAGWNVGVDWADLHAGLGETGLHPGRMPLVTSLMFVLYGACCILVSRPRVAANVVRGLLALIVGCGLLAVAGHALGLDTMFDINRFRLMSAPAAVGFVLIGTGSWLAWNSGPAVAVSEDNRIVLTGVAVVLVFGVVIGLAGLIALKNNTAQSLGDGLLLTAQGRANLLVTVLEDNISDLEDLGRRPEIVQLYSERSPRTEAFRQAAQDELGKGYSAIEFRDGRGIAIAGAGRFLPESAILFPLKRKYAKLYWSGVLALRGTTEVRDGAAVIGYVVTEQSMPVLTGQIFDVRSLGSTGEISVCSADERLLYCAPQRLRRGAYEVTRRPNGIPTPMDLAIEGKNGVMESVDYRQQRVLSAHAPAGDLGIVVKMDNAEIFEPLRARLAYLVPLMVLVLAIGVLVLRLAVKPMATRLHASEKQLTLALQASRLALWDWDIRSGGMYLSDQWQAILGGEPRPTHTTLAELRGLVHPEDAPQLDQRLKEVLKGVSPNYDMEHRVRALDGGWIWVRSRGEVVERSRSGRAMRMTGTNADISAQMEMQGRLLHQATHDTLTGLPNRSLFYDRLAQAIARSRRGGTLMAVLYLDIDKFKSINDTLGHDAGDDLLKAFSKRLADCVRATDTVARLGGDEYAVVLESLAGRDDGCRIAEKIVHAMRPAFALQDRSLEITSSVGVAFYEGESELGPDSLVKRADDALYRAKHAGRNNYQVHDEKA